MHDRGETLFLERLRYLEQSHSSDDNLSHVRRGGGGGCQHIAVWEGN